MKREQITTPPCEVLWFDSAEALAQAAARDWLDALSEHKPSESPFTVALSGGRIARTFFDVARECLSSHAELLRNVHFFWADERCVPPWDSESNYGVAARKLLNPLSVSEEAVHRIKGENDPLEAAQEASQALTTWCRPNAEGRPVLNLVFLGMGEDGHVASLFPGEPQAAADSSEVFRPVVASKPPPHRITVGYPVLADARAVWALVSGAGKDDALMMSLEGQSVTPFRRVLCSRSGTSVYTDLSPVGTSEK